MIQLWDKKTVRKSAIEITIGIALVICCIIGYPHLHDKFLIVRYVAVSAGLAVLFLCSLIAKKHWLIPNTPAFYLFLLFTVLCGCSILWATNFAEAIYAASLVVMGFLITLGAYTLLSNSPDIFKKTLWIVAAFILIVYLLVAIFQLFHIEDFSFRQLYRIDGINGHKNLLSVMLFLLSSFLLSSLPEIKSKLLKAIPLVLFALSVTVIILLKSRAVILSMITAIAVFLILYFIHSKRPVCSRKAKIATTLVAIALAFVFLTVLLRLFVKRPVPKTAEKSEIEYRITSTSSLAERFLLWDKTYQIVDKHPFLGCGIGNWQIHYPDAGLKGLYRADIWSVNFAKPHNEYLGILAETGYLGLFLYVAFLCFLIVFSGSVILETTDKKAFLFGAVTLSVLCGCCVNSLFDFPNSRIEHIVWMGILYAILLHFTTSRKGTCASKAIGWGWNFLLFSIAASMILIGALRFRGEHETIFMQRAQRSNDWNLVRQHCDKAISPFYTIDPVGMPLHWYQGKALKAMDNPLSINSFRNAYRHAPFCKENLNDLGLNEYYQAHDFAAAERHLSDAIRISPNYLYPYLNLAYIHLSENEPQKAKEVADRIYFDEQKRDVMKADAVFFEPYNTETVRQKIDADYEAVLKLNATIDSFLKP
ncbi:MAG: O-antigen ligase family protein [Bacteroidales bacterium]|nr:O-antigen ligase family protein [Bacteroidales bacterium]